MIDAIAVGRQGRIIKVVIKYQYESEKIYERCGLKNLLQLRFKVVSQRIFLIKLSRFIKKFKKFPNSVFRNSGFL